MEDWTWAISQLGGTRIVVGILVFLMLISYLSLSFLVNDKLPRWGRILLGFSCSFLFVGFLGITLFLSNSVLNLSQAIWLGTCSSIALISGTIFMAIEFAIQSGNLKKISLKVVSYSFLCLWAISFFSAFGIICSIDPIDKNPVHQEKSVEFFPVASSQDSTPGLHKYL